MTDQDNFIQVYYRKTKDLYEYLAVEDKTPSSTYNGFTHLTQLPFSSRWEGKKMIALIESSSSLPENIDIVIDDYFN